MSAVSLNPGVIVSDRDGLGLASVLVRNERSAALAQRFRERLGIELPRGPNRTSMGDLALAGTAPGAWLASRERAGNEFARSLAEIVGDLASVSDQSDGYAVLRIRGPEVRKVLSKMLFIDLHSRKFKVGDVAGTVGAHMSATIWRLADGNDGTGTFEVAVYRSLAASFWCYLSDSAAEFGLDVSKGKPRPAVSLPALGSEAAQSVV